MTYAEQTLPSGVTAVLVATVPLSMVASDRLVNRVRIAPPTACALLVGLVGVVILARPDAGAGGTGRVGPSLLVLGASASWRLGSVLASRLVLPVRPLVGASMEMLAGGAVLLVVGALAGEFSDLDLAGVSTASAAALLSLIVSGSLLGLSAYVVALQRLPTRTVATYAYVNPVVAVVLGALLLDERLTGRTLLGAGVVVAGVVMALTVRARTPVSRCRPGPEAH